MSNAVFPTLAGLTWNVLKTPGWSTKVLRSVGGKEQRASFWSSPIYTWQLTYELLRANALLELQSLVGFFNARQGKFDSFLFSDPSDNTVTTHGFGVGNGSTTAFQLQRTIAGFRLIDQWESSFPTPTIPRTNVLSFSEQFENAVWVKTLTGGGTAPVVTVDQGIAPDGTVTADRIVFVAPVSGDASSLSQDTGITPLGVTSFAGSLYLKAFGPADVGKILLYRQVGRSAYVPAVLTANWQRVVSVEPAVLTYYAELALRPDAGGSTGTVAALVWGAQLEAGTAATPYMKTTSGTTTSVPSYYPAGGDGFEPVLDVNVSVAPVQVFVSDWQGSQLQYQTPRANLLLRSEQCDNAAWTKSLGGAGSAPVVTADLGVAPDGTTTADKVVFVAPGAGDSSSLAQSSNVTAGLRYTESFFVKAFAAGDVGKTLVFRGPGGSTYTPIVLTANWQRASATELAPSVAGQLEVTLRPDVGSSSGTVTAFVWGGQLELGSVLTSYIKTTTAIVTRTDFTLSASGLVTFAIAPLLAAILTWTGSYYWRVRFDLDQAEFNNFMYQLWEAKRVTLVSVK